ncbi:hypothetical protein FITA111629_08350 [Filibacter tadaridae]|uniref:Uncharacterized protein n=1 Tax=Filibacter tadaridae TaxID=2483811 RepID=A0A3P5WRB5_9BACL|nr:hypothetical protein FILTAD_01375 [Filibacter tadaridae]
MSLKPLLFPNMESLLTGTKTNLGQLVYKKTVDAHLIVDGGEYP